MNARDLLAAATPPYRTRGGKGYTDLFDRDGQVIASIVPVEDAALIVAAVNEYEALLDLEDAIRRGHKPIVFSEAGCRSCAALARLDAVRNGALSERGSTGSLPGSLTADPGDECVCGRCA